MSLGLVALVAPARAFAQTTCTNTNCTGYAITITCSTNPCNGTAATECIKGTSTAQTINGNGGNDCIIGGGGNDIITTGSGNDIIFGGAGNDQISSGGGDDTITGGNGDDQIFGGDGNDTINGGAGDDVISGGPGNDTINGGNNNDTLTGGGGTDTINGGAGTDSCSSSASPRTNCEQATPAVIARVRADGAAGLRWETAAQIGTIGFEVYRETRGRWTKLHDGLLSAVHDAPLGQYALEGFAPGEGRYWIADTDVYGRRTLHGPFVVDAASSAAPQASSAFTSHALPRARRRSSPSSSEPAVAAFVVLPPAAAARADVEVTDLVRVSASQLANVLGLPEGDVRAQIENGDLTVSRGNHSVPYRAAADGDAIEWYGRASDSIYSRTRAYVIRAAAGPHIQLAPVPAYVGTGAAAFTDMVHAEQNAFAGTIVSPDPTTDYWFWTLLSSNAADSAHDLTAVLHGVAAAQPSASITVRLYGATTSGIDGEHQVGVSLNGVQLGTASFEGIGAFEQTYAVPENTLIEGENTLRLERDAMNSAASSVVYVQNFDVKYAREYRAQDDALTFVPDEVAPITITGFGDPAIELFDVTDPDAPIELHGSAVQPDGAGGHALGFVAQAGRRYFATARQATSIETVAGDFASDLTTAHHAADYVMIAPRSSFQTLAPLIALRQTQGLATELVDVQDVYDELSDGNQDPNAIHAFIAHAATRWNSTPRYFVLAGSGHYDFRGYASQDPNPIPPLMRRGEGGLYPADSQFADLRGNDGIADVALGRLPARDDDELAAIVDKIVSYETNASHADSDRLLMLADLSTNGEAFDADTRFALDAVPQDLPSVTLAHSAFMDVAALRSALFAELQTGAAVFNYFGHGGVTKLGKTTDILLDSDVDTLVQSSPLPLFTSMTCMTGSYAFPGYEALAPQLVRTQGKGAVAAWAATGQVMDGSSRTLLAHFFQTILHDDVAIGDAIQQALATELREYPELGGSLESLALYALFGDPAMHLHIPRARPGASDGGAVLDPTGAAPGESEHRSGHGDRGGSLDIDVGPDAGTDVHDDAARHRHPRSASAADQPDGGNLAQDSTHAARANGAPGAGCAVSRASAATAPASLFMLLLALLLSRRRRATRY